LIRGVGRLARGDDRLAEARDLRAQLRGVLLEVFELASLRVGALREPPPNLLKDAGDDFFGEEVRLDPVQHGLVHRLDGTPRG
jgi:hypothetical protein